MAIWTGTVSVTNGDATVTVDSGDALNQFNCTPDGMVVIEGVVYFVLSRTDTTTFELTRPYDGSTDTGVTAEISPLNQTTTSLLTLSSTASRLAAQLDIFDKTGPWFYYNLIGATGDTDPDAGNVALSTLDFGALSPGDSMSIYLDNVDAKGRTITGLLDTLVGGTIIVVCSLNSTSYIAMQLGSGIVDATDYRKSDATYVGHDGVLSAAEPVFISYARVGQGLEVDAQGVFADRDDYDDEPEGFIYYSVDGDGSSGVGTLYRKASNSSGDWSVGGVLQGTQGPPGNDGDPGPPGNDGDPGADGASAYDVAVANGFVGNEAAWLASLNGDDGDDGDPGADGADGTDPGILLSWDEGTSDSNLGAGKIWADDTLDLATTLFVSKTNRAGDDIGDWLLGLDASASDVKGQIVITRSGGNAQAIVNITSDGVDDRTGYVAINIDGHSGADGFTTNDAVSFQFSRTGDPGTLDGEGVAGPDGGVAANEYVLFDGTTGQIIKGSGHLYGRYSDKAANLSDLDSKQAGYDNISLKATNIASATTTDLSTATGRFAHITGTTTITGFGTAAAGVERELTFDGALTITHNGTSMITLGGASFTTEAGDTATVVSEGSGNWRFLSYQRASRDARRSDLVVPTYVASRTAMKALVVAKDKVAILTEAGREGTFIWKTGDYSAQVTADTAEGIYVKATSTASSSGAWVRAYEGLAKVSWFGDSSSNSTTAFAALKAAWGVTKKLELTPGNTYLWTEQLTSNGADVDVRGNGATAMMSETAGVTPYAFALIGGYGTEYAVDASGTDGDGNFYFHLTSGPAMPSLKSGDTIKVVDDTDMSPVTRGRQGEHFVVWKVDAVNRRVYPTEAARFTYATDIRLAKMSDVSIRIEGLVVDYEDRTFTDSAAHDVNHAIRIRSAVRPVVKECRFLWGYSIHHYFRDCFEPLVVNPFCVGGKDTDELDNGGSGNGYFTYGVAFSRCTAGKVVGGTFSRLRHAIVGIASGDDTATAMDMERYGETFACGAVGATAYDCFGASFDTHHGSRDFYYSDCHSFRSRAGGFNIRGQDVKVIGGSSNDDRFGLVAFQETALAASCSTDRVVVEGLVIRDPTEAAIVVDNATETTVHGGQTIITKGSASTALFQTRNKGDLKIAAHKMRLGATFSALSSVIDINTSTLSRLHVEDVTVDCRGVGGTTSAAFIKNSGSTNPLLIIDGLFLYTTSSGARIDKLIDGSLNSGTRIYEVNAKNVATLFTSYDFDTAGAMLQGPVDIYDISGAQLPVGARTGWNGTKTGFDPGNIGAQSSGTTTVTVTGANVGDIVAVALSISHGGMIIQGRVSSSNTVTVTYHNPTASGIDLASHDIYVRVLPKPA